jgi:hypothetical protein
MLVGTRTPRLPFAIVNLPRCGFIQGLCELDRPELPLMISLPFISEHLDDIQCC